MVDSGVIHPFAGVKFFWSQVWLIIHLLDSSFIGFKFFLDSCFAGFKFCWMDATLAGFKFCWIQLMVDSGVIHHFAGFKFFWIQVWLIIPFVGFDICWTIGITKQISHMMQLMLASVLTLDSYLDSSQTFPLFNCLHCFSQRDTWANRSISVFALGCVTDNKQSLL